MNKCGYRRLRNATATILMCTAGIINAQNIYVSPGGDDANAGSFASPKKTIQAATGLLASGDTLFLRGGSYHEEVLMQNLNGSEANPIVFKSYGDEIPVIDGTIDLEDIKVPDTNWELALDSFPGTTNIYKLQLTEDIWQLWIRKPELMKVANAVGGDLADFRMQVIARWPNGNTNPTDPLIKAGNGIDAAANTWWSMTTTWAFAASPQTSHTVIENNPNRYNLAGTGKSFKGGTALLSIVKQGPANTPVQILEHEAGSNVFTHSGMDESYGLYSNTSTLGPSYIVQHLQALDIPGEWYYDDESKTVYLWPEDSSDPGDMEIRGKTQTYGLDLGNCDHIVFDGIGLFGTSMRLDGDDISFINGAISYPDMPKTLLGYSGVVIPAIYANDCWNFHMENCIVEYSQSSIIQVKNVGGTFINNYFHHLGMSGMGASGSFHNVNTFLNNTIRTVGNRAAVKANSDPQEGRIQSWNILDGWGFLYANDGVGFQSSQGGSVNSERAYNWFIRSNRSGHRYDGPEEGKGFPTLGLSHHLVALRGVSVSTTIKGDYNQMYNYLGILSTNENGDIAVRWNLDTGEGNRHSILRNCAAEGINIGKWDPLPCINSNNWDASKKGGSMLDFHPEADILDFRPRAGAPLIDAGFHVPGITDGYLGSAPDIGAYEWGDDKYWIPGYRTGTTTLPIPFDGAVDMKLDRDLIFRHAYQRDKATVYFGINKASVQAASQATAKEAGLADIPGGDVVRISLDSGRNIVTPTMLMGNPNAYDPAPYLLVDDPHISLSPNTTYYWRADAVDSEGAIINGETWSFSTGDQTQLVQFKIYTETEGVVTPAQSATIEIENSIYTTDSSGFIYGLRLSPANYSYSIYKKGFHPGNEVLILDSDTLITDTISSVNFQFAINIIDVDLDTPVQDAVVNLGEMQAIADEQGAVQFTSIDYGYYMISVDADEYILSEIQNFEIYSDTVLNIYIEKDYRSGQFTILDMYSNEPVHRAVMTSLQGENVLTNEEGELGMSKVTSGWWIYQVEHEDYFPVFDSIFVTDDTIEAVILLSKNKANVTIQVSDQDGAISGANINLGTYNAASTQDGMAWFYFLPAREEYSYTVENEGYATVSSSIYLEQDTTINIQLQLVGISGAEAQSSFLVYPNPAKEKLYVSCAPGDWEIKLIGLDGRIWWNKKFIGEHVEFEVSDVPAGIYTLKIDSAGSNFTSRVIKL